MINLKKSTPIKMSDPDIVTQPDYICKCGYHISSCTCKYDKRTDPTNVSNQFDGLGIRTDNQGFIIV